MFGPDKQPEPVYDDGIHELHATTVELKQNVHELTKIAETYLETSNPLIALTVTLLNRQQMEDPK